MNQTRTRQALIALLLTTVVAVTACDSSSTVTRTDDNFTVSIPAALRTIQAVRGKSLTLEVSVNDVLSRTVPVTDEDSVQFDIQIPIDQANELDFAWYTVVDGQNVLLADYSTTVGATQATVTVPSYLSTGTRFDEDGDGRTNLSEVRDNRNPLSEVDLEVQMSTATFLPANRFITNDGLDTNNSGDDNNPDPDSRFSLWHNGTDLNLYLCGQDATLSESSEQYWQDDTIFVFFDGANSDNGTYDGFDDYQIAFVRSTEELIVSKGGGNPGCGDGSCITYNFFNSSSSCQYELSAKFPLASMNLTVGQQFGFDIEITDDDNGGLREDSAAWIGYDDRSDIDPSTFGTAFLQ